MSDDRSKTAPKVLNITTEYTFQSFDSLLLIDAGSDGFKIRDSATNEISIPTGVPVSISGKAGQASGPLTIKAPTTGSLNVSAVYYS